MVMDIVAHGGCEGKEPIPPYGWVDEKREKWQLAVGRRAHGSSICVHFSPAFHNRN